jgi:hypothetical protein
MLNALPAPILLDIAIIFTALSWGLGFYLVDKRVHIFASLAVGCFVCLFGYSVESLGAPPWVVVAAPVPLDLLLLWYVLRKPRKWQWLTCRFGQSTSLSTYFSARCFVTTP